MKTINLKTILRHITMILAFWIPAGTLYAYDQVVTGRGDPAVDVAAVQAAVDKGGEVLLQGVFDFGPKGQVRIQKDVAVAGESDAQGRPRTKIRGGLWTFYSPLPSTELPLAGPGPRIKIRNIHFDGATWSPLHFPYTGGAEIVGNKITNVRPGELPIKWQGGDTIQVQAGVILGTRFAHREKFLPAVTGRLLVENNQIDLACDNPEGTIGYGAFFPWTWAADIVVKGNIIRNASRSSLESIDNYRDHQGRGSVTISRNDILMPDKGCPFPGASSYPIGIRVGWFFDFAAGADPARYSKITIADNKIEANGRLSTAISSMSDGAVIRGNTLVLKGGPESYGITQLGSNGRISGNTITGGGAWALGALPYKELLASRNTFDENDTRSFKAAKADFYCAGSRNTMIGPKCSVLDKGQENQILAHE